MGQNSQQDAEGTCSGEGLYSAARQAVGELLLSREQRQYLGANEAALGLTRQLRLVAQRRDCQLPAVQAAAALCSGECREAFAWFSSIILGCCLHILALSSSVALIGVSCSSLGKHRSHRAPGSSARGWTDRVSSLRTELPLWF